MAVADSLYQLANAKLVCHFKFFWFLLHYNNFAQKPLIYAHFEFKADSAKEAGKALAILRVASCMGHIQSQYMTGVIKMVGLGVPQDKTQVRAYVTVLFLASKRFTQ